MNIIKNIEHSKVLDLAGQVEYLPGQIVSKIWRKTDTAPSDPVAFEGRGNHTHGRRLTRWLLPWTGTGG